MNTENRFYTGKDHGLAARLLQGYDQAQKEKQEKAARNGHPMPTVETVQQTGQRASAAVRGLESAYADPEPDETPTSLANDRNVERSGVFVRAPGPTGAKEFKRFDDKAYQTHPERLQDQLDAITERASRIMVDYNKALLEVDQADKEIARLQSELRQFSDDHARYSEDRFLIEVKKRNEEVASWQAWRDGQTRLLAEYSREVKQNTVRAASIREIKANREAQDRLPNLKGEYRELSKRDAAFQRTLAENEDALVQLQDRLAEAMLRASSVPANDNALTQRTDRAARVAAAPEKGQNKPIWRNLWERFRGVQEDGVEARSPEYAAQSTEANSDVKMILSQIGERNRAIEQVTSMKTANDRRLDALAEQIQAIENPPQKRAA